jgi:hypothetical protein
MRKIDNLLELVINGDLQTPDQVTQLLNIELLTSDNLLELAQECKNEIYANADKILNNDSTQNYIQKEQLKYLDYSRRLLFFGDFRGNLFQRKTKIKNQGDFLKYLFLSTESIFSYIEKRFLMYINMNIQCSYNTKLHEIPIIDALAASIKENLVASNINEKLVKEIAKIICKAENIVYNDNVSLKSLIYFKLLLTNLKELIDKNLFNEDVISKCLFQINLNSTGFFYYLSSKIMSEINAISDKAGKIERLNYFLKVYKQEQITEEASYTENANIKKQITAWLKEEIKFISYRIYNDINPDLITAYLDDIVEEKLEINLSVNQIAYFLKLGVEAKIITNNNKEEVFRIISKFVSSKKSQNISSISLNRKFYETDNNTVNAVKEHLIKMINLANLNHL